MLRTYAHETITEMANMRGCPVINALSDLEHPCQAIADFMTLEERFGTVRGLKFTYVGDGNNVCHSLMLTAALLGAHCTVALRRRVLAQGGDCRQGEQIVANLAATLTLTQDPVAAVKRRGCNLHRRLHQHGL